MRRVGLCACVVVALACRSETKPSPQPDAAPPAPVASALDGGAGARGESTLEALLEAQLRCTWEDVRPVGECPAHDEWSSTALKSGDEADPKLVLLLERTQPEARMLACEALDDPVFSVQGKTVPGRLYTRDRALAERVVLAAEKEKNLRVAEKLGSVVGKIDLAATGLGDRVAELAASSRPAELRFELVRSWLMRNPAQFAATKRLGASADADMRRAAVLGVWFGFPRDRADDACKFLAARVDDQDAGVAATAADRITYGTEGARCASSWPAVFANIERRGRSGRITSELFVRALANVFGQDKADPGSRRAALSAARAVASGGKNDAAARAAALDLAGKHDDKATALAKTLLADPEPEVQASAKRILNP